MGRPFARVGITGYPESHPRIDDDITVQAMWDKRHHSSYIVSNLCFDPAVLSQVGNPDPGARRHAPALRGTGGSGGPGEAAAHGGPSGVAESAGFLAGHTDWFLRLGLPGGYSPERLLDRTGPALTAPGGSRGRAAPVHLQPGQADRRMAGAIAAASCRPGSRPASHLSDPDRAAEAGHTAQAAMRSLMPTERCPQRAAPS